MLERVRQEVQDAVYGTIQVSPITRRRIDRVFCARHPFRGASTLLGDELRDRYPEARVAEISRSIRNQVAGD